LGCTAIALNTEKREGQAWYDSAMSSKTPTSSVGQTQFTVRDALLGMKAADARPGGRLTVAVMMRCFELETERLKLDELLREETTKIRLGDSCFRATMLAIGVLSFLKLLDLGSVETQDPLHVYRESLRVSFLEIGVPGRLYSEEAEVSSDVVWNVLNPGGRGGNPLEPGGLAFALVVYQHACRLIPLSSSCDESSRALEPGADFFFVSAMSEWLLRLIQWSIPFSLLLSRRKDIRLDENRPVQDIILELKARNISPASHPYAGSGCSLFILVLGLGALLFALWP